MAAAIEKRWPSGFWDAHGMPRGKAWDLRRTAYIVTFACLFGMLQIELALWLRGILESPFPVGLPPVPLDLDRWNLLLMLPAVLNGWILDRYLTARTAGPWALAGWVRLARAAVLSIPVLGLWGIPAWQGIQARRPGWALRRVEPRPLGRRSLRPGISFLRGAAARIGLGWRRLASSFWGFALWLILCQVVPFNSLLSALTAEGPLTPERILLLVLAGALCHAVAYLGVTRYLAGRRLRVSTSRASEWRRRLGPLLLLLPMPFPLLSFLVWRPLTEEAGEEATLVHSAQAARFRRPLLAGWGLRHGSGGRLGLASLGQGGSSASRGAGRQAERQQSLCRLKSAFLFLEGAALSLLVAHLAGRAPLSMSDPQALLLPFAGLILLGLLLEAVSLGWRVACWFLRRSLPGYQPAGHFLAATQVALLLGLLLGSSLALGTPGEAGVLLQALGWISLSMAVLLLPVSLVLNLPGRHVAVAALWLPLFLTVLATGWLLGTPYFEPGDILLGLEGLAFAAPLAGMLSGWLLLPSLLHPFTFRDSTDPDLPTLVRLRLAFLAATALLPLGAVAAPLWTPLSRRLPELYEKNGSGSDGRSPGW